MWRSTPHCGAIPLAAALRNALLRGAVRRAGCTRKPPPDTIRHGRPQSLFRRRPPAASSIFAIDKASSMADTQEIPPSPRRRMHTWRQIQSGAPGRDCAGERGTGSLCPPHGRRLLVPQVDQETRGLLLSRADRRLVLSTGGGPATGHISTPTCSIILPNKISVRPPGWPKFGRNLARFDRNQPQCGRSHAKFGRSWADVD